MSDTPQSGEAAGCRIQCRERRAAVRHFSTMEASYHPIAVRTLGPTSPARIWDISLGGLSLVASHSYESGTLLAVVPEVLPQSLDPALQVRVIHSVPHTDGLWMIGCEFPIPLTEEELRILLT